MDNILSYDKLSKEDLLNLFKKYEFKDQLGHKLENCDEFIQLIDYIISLRK